MSGLKNGWVPAEHPYDPDLVRGALEDVRLGCVASVTHDGELDVCGKPAVAVRRWYPNEGYEADPVDPRGSYGCVCAYHAIHDVVPLEEVLEAVGR